MRISMQSSLHAWLSMIEQCHDLLMEHQRMSRCLVDGIVGGGEGIFQALRVCCHPEVHHIRRRHLIFMTLSLLI
jgi:hypothetical protein